MKYLVITIALFTPMLAMADEEPTLVEMPASVIQFASHLLRLEGGTISGKTADVMDACLRDQGPVRIAMAGVADLCAAVTKSIAEKEKRKDPDPATPKEKP